MCTQFGEAEVLSYRLHGLSEDIKCAITLSSSSFCLVGQKLQATGVLWLHFAVRSTVLLVLSAQRGADLKNSLTPRIQKNTDSLSPVYLKEMKSTYKRMPNGLARWLSQ